MQYRKLGQTEIDVSVICLGTMTYGEQNTEKEAHKQLDYALDHGVNFIDTAEMYPVPPMAETCGKTEAFIGTWDKLKSHRDKIILATKVAGPSDWLTHIRDGKARLDRKNIREAIDASLKKLNTDYIDLYQLHWPDRNTNFFGQLSYTHNPEETSTPIEETLEALAEIQKEGKVRHFGLSNETPYGAMKFLEAAGRLSLPRMASIQNPYSLLNRSYEIGLSEISIREQIGLLAYSPLGFGVLSGKYVENTASKDARLNKFDRFTRYTGDKAVTATKQYVSLARELGITPAQLALSYVNSRPFVTSNIIGATTLPQLEENIGSIDVKLGSEVTERIESIHQSFPNPAP